MTLLAALAAAGLAAAPADLGEGVGLAVPEGMERLAPATFALSQALVPRTAGAERGVLAAFAEPAEGGATLAVARVQAPLSLEVAARQDLAEAVARHFRADLDLEVVVERPVLLDGPGGRRLEVRAHTRVGSQRVVRFAFVPSGPGHLVLAFSMPASREDELQARVREAFESLRAPPPLPSPGSMRLVVRAAAFGAAGLVLVLGWRLWRRREAARASEE